MTSTQTPSSLAGAYEPASPGTRGWREAMARPLRLDGKRVTVVVEGPAGRTAYLFVGGIAGEPYELPADVTDVNAWAQQMVAEQVAQPDAAPAAAPRPVATVSVPGSFAEWLEGTNAMTGDDDHDPRSLALRLAVQGGRRVQRGRSWSLVVEGDARTMSVLTEYTDAFLNTCGVEDESATQAELSGARKTQERALAARAALVATERASRRRQARRTLAMYGAVKGGSFWDKVAVFHGFNPGVRVAGISAMITKLVDDAWTALEGAEWEAVSPAEAEKLFDLADRAADYRAARTQHRTRTS
ncbi:hypothetical protein OG871_40670 (plasmid) [Kitasatospora sp. NBC_00374]|uniref:hypothetical protein n=1 Tax=Kitasatospora sp. NBC_00374 TaxID=2975964 RepID=UPI002F907CB3